MRAAQRKHHVIYKTTCLITGRWYIGMHSTDDLNDGYIGSGQVLWKSIKKYGKDQHRCEILEHLSDRKALITREETIVNEELLADPLCMNLRNGGTGAMPGASHRPDTLKKISTNSKLMWQRLKEQGYKPPVRTAESRAKTGAAARNPSIETLAKMSAASSGRQFSQETLAKRSRALSKPCTVDGITIFQSRGALREALGQGKSGLNNPNFRYME